MRINYLVLMICLLSSVDGNAQSWVDKAKKSIENSRNKVYDNLRKKTDRAKETTKKYLNESRDKVNEYGTKVRDYYDNRGRDMLNNARERFSDYSSKAAQQLNDTYRRYGPEVSAKLKSAYDKYGDKTAEAIHNAYITYGPVAGEKIQEAYDRFGPEVGIKIKETYDRFGPTAGKKIREAYYKYGPEVANGIRQSYEKYGPQAAQKILDIYNEYGNAIGDKVSDTFKRYGEATGQKLVDSYYEYGPVVGNKTRDILNEYGHAACRIFVDKIKKIQNTVTDPENVGWAAAFALAMYRIGQEESTFFHAKPSAIKRHQFVSTKLAMLQVWTSDGVVRFKDYAGKRIGNSGDDMLNMYNYLEKTSFDELTGTVKFIDINSGKASTIKERLKNTSSFDTETMVKYIRVMKSLKEIQKSIRETKLIDEKESDLNILKVNNG